MNQTHGAANNIDDVVDKITTLKVEEETSSLWTDDISKQINEYLSLENQLTSIPWEDTGIPSQEMYFVDPDKERFDSMCKQLTSVLLVKLIAVVKENNLDIMTLQDDADDESNTLKITSSVLKELEQYVLIILEHYIAVAYHSSEHALHVTLNANKLLSFILQEDVDDRLGLGPCNKKISYGIQSSALMHFSFIFSALIHDVQHLGVTNRTLMDEEHPLAILYNDQNMLEQQSLTISFKEFLKEDYVNLRNILFAPDYDCKYSKFRRLVVDLVLCTDIASPERMQLTKSKFKEAFGDTIRKRNSLTVGGRRSICYSKQSSMGTSVASSCSEYDSGNDGWLSVGSFSSDEEEDEEEDDDEPQVATPVFSTRRDDLSQDDDNYSSDSSSSLSQDESEGTDQYNLSNLRMRNKNYRSLPNLPSQKAKSVGTLSQLRSSNNAGGQSIFGRTSPGASGTGAGVSRVGRIGNRHSSLPTNFFQSRTYRLGIRVALDFTGLPVPRFPDEETGSNSQKKKTPMKSGTSHTSNAGSPSNQKSNSGEHKGSKEDDEDLNQEDPLKAQVILELMIRAADIGATMQSFHSFTRWGRRLYVEQKNAFEEGRGVDPDSYWLGGQIAFLDSYAKQLAKSMEDSFVFGEKNNIFVPLIEENKKMWKEKGSEITEQTQNDWKIERSKAK